MVTAPTRYTRAPYLGMVGCELDPTFHSSMTVKRICRHGNSATQRPPPPEKKGRERKKKPESHNRLDLMWLLRNIHFKDWHTSLNAFTVCLIRHALDYASGAQETTAWLMASHTECLCWSKDEQTRFLVGFTSPQRGHVSYRTRCTSQAA